MGKKSAGGPARLYQVAHPDAPWQVVFRDPTRREQSGRAFRVVKWFADRAHAVAYQAHVNERLLAEGTAGLAFDVGLRADAQTARRRLDAAGHHGVSLAQLAERFAAQVTSHAATVRPIAPEVAAFLQEKAHVDGASVETVKNLKTRLGLWLALSAVATVGDVGRASVECLRTRPVGPQTRRNDLNAVSSFCSWLLDAGKLDHHPLKGLKRPRVVAGKKPTWSAAECARVLAQAPRGADGAATLAVLLFAGARPSELAETRLLYGRQNLVRIEGGKLRGRANRVVPMGPALRAWLAAAGQPERVAGLTRSERAQVAAAAGVTWAPDICRHTAISFRLQVAQNDALVAREAGTSETVIYRHYHGLRAPAEARAFFGLRPAKLPPGHRGPGASPAAAGAE